MASKTREKHRVSRRSACSVRRKHRVLHCLARAWPPKLVKNIAFRGVRRAACVENIAFHSVWRAPGLQNLRKTSRFAALGVQRAWKTSRFTVFAARLASQTREKHRVSRRSACSVRRKHRVLHCLARAWPPKLLVLLVAKVRKL
jgi:hypothetical protein